ncbi:TPA: SIS domain-containing protein [Streptococcus suis]
MAVYRGKCKHIRYNDFVLFISLNGVTLELVEAAKQLAASEISTLLITSNSSSTLAKLCDLVFLGFKTKDSYFPEFEVKSRLPLVIISRILVDAYAARINIFEKDVSN